MPPKKKPKKKPKKDPKTISQNVKQSVVIKIGDISAKKKRTYTKRAHITPKKDAPIGPVNNPQPQLMLQPQRVEPVSRLDPSIEKLKMSANQFDDLSKQTNDLLQRISRINLIQAHEQLKPPPVVESLIEQPFQTPAATPKSKQKKITEFMTPQYTRLEPQFRDTLGLSVSTQTLNEALKSPVEPPNTGSKVGLTIPQTTDRPLILEEPDDDEQVVVQELSSGAGEEVVAQELSSGAGEQVITELGPSIVGTTQAEEEYSDDEPMEVLVARVARENKEKEAREARENKEKEAELSETKATRGRPIGSTKEAIAEKRQGQAEEVATALLSNFPIETGLSSRSFSGDTLAPSVSGMQTPTTQTPGTISTLTMTPGILTPAPPGLTPSLNEVLSPAIKAPGMDRLLDAPISTASTASTAALSSPTLAESTASTKKGAGRPPGSKGKTDEEKQTERLEHRAEVQRILGILRTNSGIYVSGKRGPTTQAETAARAAYIHETTPATSKIKARLDEKAKKK